MRKKQDFVVKGKQVFVGLEDSKRTWKLCVRSERMVVHETSMPTEYDNLRSYLQGRYPGCTVRVMYEAGFAGFWLHDLLVADGIECVVTPAHMVIQEKVNKVKTDKIDARRLAKNLENGDYVVCHIPDRERREDRQISRTLNGVQRKIVSTKNQIRRFLDFHGLNNHLPAGPWSESRYHEVRHLRLSVSFQISLDAYLEILEHLQVVKSKLLVVLKGLCDKDRYHRSVQIKQSCSGVGWLSAIRFTLEWGKMSRFKDGQRLASFVGLTSREYSTGETIRRGRITGQGNDQVRAWLIQCAWRAIRLDPVLLDKFNRVWKNSGSKKKAIVATARKLAIRMRAIELADQEYCVGVIQ